MSKKRFNNKFIILILIVFNILALSVSAVTTIDDISVNTTNLTATFGNFTGTVFARNYSCTVEIIFVVLFVPAWPIP